VIERGADGEEGEGSLELVRAGTEIAGGAAGVAAALVAGPLGGVAAGVAATKLLRRVGDELYRRVLGPRQQVRAGAALAIAAAEIAARVKAGEQLREDGLFDKPTGRRNDAEEIAEGILLAAAGEHEERKVPFLGHLLASIALDAAVSVDEAHFLVQLLESLTYRQLVSLAVLGDESRSMELRRVGAKAEVFNAPAVVAVAAEFSDLVTKGLYAYSETGPTFADMVEIPHGGYSKGILTRGARTELAETFARLACLGAIPERDQDAFLRTLDT
jgi:hypothetical protein